MLAYESGLWKRIKTAFKRSQNTCITNYVLYFDDLTLQEMVLMPNEVYQGVLFFKAVELDKVYRDDSNFNVTSLYTKKSLIIKVSVADLETRERMHFGPFPISVR